jgi:Protein of unknown function (DUF4244)
MSKDVSVMAPGAVVEAAPHCRDQRGMVSAEWAVGIIAAVAIAGVLLGIVTGGPVHDANNGRCHISSEVIIRPIRVDDRERWGTAVARLS